mgnify:CR=1 FL=1
MPSYHSGIDSNARSTTYFIKMPLPAPLLLFKRSMVSVDCARTYTLHLVNYQTLLWFWTLEDYLWVTTLIQVYKVYQIDSTQQLARKITILAACFERQRHHRESLITTAYDRL